MASHTAGERDAITVEIGFAFFSALVLAAGAWLVLASPLWFLGLEGAPARAVGLGAAICAGGVWAWRVVRVLWRFRADRA